MNGNKTYATFGIARSGMQIRQALDDRRNAGRNMADLFALVQTSERRMAAQLGHPIENLQILEVGPGQGLERARYFGLKNQVIGLDLDVIPTRKSLAAYWSMLRVNGFGRLAKSIGRSLIVAKANERAWSKAVGAGGMPLPEIRQGDICGTVAGLDDFDLVMSWSVFEHLPDPAQALENIIHFLKPGGVLYLSIHLFTANNGHHDMRAFTGQEDQLPVWGHLRPAQQNQLQPSCYLNRWRLAQWRALFNALTPGHSEYLENYESRARLSPRLTPEIRKELQDYGDEELFTVDAVYCWRKPG